MKQSVFRGSAVALVTPFHPDGSVNFDKLGELIDWQIESGTDALVIAGTTGEGATLSDEEHRACIRYSVKRTAGCVPVIAGTGSNDTAYAIDLSRAAEDAGADALLLVTPYYNKCTQKGLVRQFRDIVESVHIPAILYNVPSRTGVGISLAAYRELAEMPNIVATKEASGDISAIAKIRAACGDKLAVYSGNDDQTVPILALGGLGVISVVANTHPRLMHDICRLWFEGRHDESSELFLRHLDYMNDLFIEVNPIPVKTAMNLMGLDVGPLRAPLYEMEPDTLARLKGTMQRIGALK